MDHTTLDRISLAMAREVAARLRRDPRLVDKAMHNLDRWSSRNTSPAMRECYSEWRGILESGDLDWIIRVLTADTEEGQRLRQNSPFAGILTPREVWAIKREAAPDGAPSA